MAQPEIIKDIDARVKDTGDTMTGNLKVPNLDVANDICRGYIYGETNSLNFRGGNPTTGRYTYLKIAEDGAYIDNQKIYYPGNKPTPADIGAVNKSGDTMTGNLFIKKSSPEIDFKNTSLTDGRLGYIMMANDQTFNFGNYLDGNNRQTLYIQPETRELRDAIKFLRCVNGTTNYYRLYGEHNKPTLSDIAFLGTNPISTTGNDTTANWATLGSGYAWYNTANQLTNQPSQWGFVVSYSQGADIFQIWNSQSGGPTYFRSGNGAGWNGGWRKNYDTSTITASTTDLTAGSSSLATGNIYLVYE